MKVLQIVVLCAVLASAALATEVDTDAEAEMELVADAEAELEAETEAETETEVEAEAEAETETDMERRKKKRDRTPPRKTHYKRPHIDMSLLRATPNVVYVPKGDPRARSPRQLRREQRRRDVLNRLTHRAPRPSHHHRPAVPVTPQPAKALKPKALHQKAPRNPKKPASPTPVTPVTPVTPAKPAGASASVPVGRAPVLKAAAPQYSSAACTAQSGTCTATCTNGKFVHNICPGPATIACCVPLAPAVSGTCLSNFNAASFAAKATSMQLAYRANGVQYDQSNRQFGSAPPVKYADCSSFVTSVLDAMGWDCLFASGRYTAAMIPIMNSRGGFHTTPKQGDIVMWTSHTGIVTQACAGGQVRMVAMGLHGCADTGCIALSALPAWGSGSFLGYWTPH